MKLNLLLLAIFGLPLSLFAQLDSFNLASYKLPEIKTHQLGFNFAGNGSTQRQLTESRAGSKTTKSSGTYQGSVSATYSSLRNTEFYQGEQYGNVSLSPYFSADDDQRNRSFSSGLSLNSVNRSYFRSGLFIQYGLTFNGTQSKRDQYSVGEEGITYLQSRLDQAVPILFGVGRIEPVQDARLAVYILQDLQASGRMKRIPDQNEILEIARVISSVKSQRFFDSREKLIWEIGMVDSCLQSKGIIASSDATYFTRLYDNWLYAAGPVRESGKRFTTGLISHLFSIGNNSYKMNSPDATSYWGSVWVEAVARMESAHPVSLSWQTGSLFELSGQLIQGFRSDSTLNWDQNRMAGLSGKVNYSIGWYPNSRTYVDLSLNLNSQLYRGVPIVKTDHSFYFELFPEIELTAHYYIAPQLRLNLSYNAVYNLNGNRWDDLYSVSNLHSFNQGFNQSFSLNITYSLF